MPENVNEMLWYALNGAILIIAFFIKGDLSAIKKDLKENRQSEQQNAKDIIALSGRVSAVEVLCKERNCA